MTTKYTDGKWKKNEIECEISNHGTSTIIRAHNDLLRKHEHLLVEYNKLEKRVFLNNIQNIIRIGSELPWVIEYAKSVMPEQVKQLTDMLEGKKQTCH
jgi:hypothetical protein